MEEFRENIEEYTRPETFFSVFNWNVDEEKTFIVYITAGEDIIHSPPGMRDKFWCPKCEEVRAAVKEHILDETKLLVCQGSIKDL